jgi:hypothetical protein
VKVEAKVAGLDAAADSGFFPGFAFCSLAMGERQFGITFGKRPLVSTVRVDQQELNGWASPPVANSRHLQGKCALWIPCRTHLRSLRRAVFRL